MSKQMIKALSILLAVCFLMSTTAAAWSTESKASGMEAKGMIKEKIEEKMSSEKGYSKCNNAEKGYSRCNNVFIRNLIIAKNIIIIKARAHPLLRAMLLKKAMTGEESMGEEGIGQEGMMGTPCEGKLAKLAVAKKIANAKDC
jgi:hypothetical protein